MLGTDEDVLTAVEASDLPEAWKRALLSLYKTRIHRNIHGRLSEIDTVTRTVPLKGYEIYQHVSSLPERMTLEVGCAYGFSTLWILGGIIKAGGGFHTAVDPYESTHWHGIGAQKVREASCSDYFELIEECSIQALPNLHKRGRSFDLVFIDGGHKFDQVIVDISCTDMILKTGGLVILDDIWLPSVRTAVSFLENNLPYERLENHHKNIAIFRKSGPDQRRWDHFARFDVG